MRRKAQSGAQAILGMSDRLLVKLGIAVNAIKVLIDLYPC
jgi:hypothetical protein